MSRSLQISGLSGPILRRLVVIAVLGIMSLVSIILLLSALVEKSRLDEYTRTRESFRTALLTEINFFETALSASILCNKPQCIKDWSAGITSSFSWSREVDLVPLGSLKNPASKTGSLETQIKAITVEEQIQMYARPIYVQEASSSGHTELKVYLSDKDPLKLRIAKIDTEQLLQQISTQMADQGVFVNASLQQSVAPSPRTMQEAYLSLDQLGLSIKLTLPKNTLSSAETEVWIMLVAAMSSTLLISVGLVVSETLRRRSAEQSARIYEERAQAGAKLAALGEMASMLSHELNQPLAAIDVYASTALYRDEIDPQVHQCLDQIKQQVQRAGLIVRSVHGFLKNKPTHVQSFNLVEVINGLAPLIEIQAQKVDATISWLLPREVWLTADQTMLEQVILNLARNGVESMRSSPPSNKVLTIAVSKKLGMRASANEVEHNPIAGRPHVEISVSDRGCGISPDMQHKIFMPFVSTKDDGVGIGLSFCRSVAEKHRGYIGFSHNDSGGTTFRFCLPDPAGRQLTEA